MTNITIPRAVLEDAKDALIDALHHDNSTLRITCIEKIKASHEAIYAALAESEKPKQSDEELALEVLDGLTMLKNSRDPYGDMQKRITKAFAKVREDERSMKNE